MKAIYITTVKTTVYNDREKFIYLFIYEPMPHIMTFRAQSYLRCWSQDGKNITIKWPFNTYGCLFLIVYWNWDSYGLKICYLHLFFLHFYFCCPAAHKLENVSIGTIFGLYNLFYTFIWLIIFQCIWLRVGMFVSAYYFW